MLCMQFQQLNRKEYGLEKPFRAKKTPRYKPRKPSTARKASIEPERDDILNMVHSTFKIKHKNFHRKKSSLTSRRPSTASTASQAVAPIEPVIPIPNQPVLERTSSTTMNSMLHQELSPFQVLESKLKRMQDTDRKQKDYHAMMTRRQRYSFNGPTPQRQAHLRVHQRKAVTQNNRNKQISADFSYKQRQLGNQHVTDVWLAPDMRIATRHNIGWGSAKNKVNRMNNQQKSLVDELYMNMQYGELLDNDDDDDDDDNDNNEESNHVFEPWLVDRPDFQLGYSSSVGDRCVRILEMFPGERTNTHLRELVAWCQDSSTSPSDFLRALPTVLLRHTVHILKSKKYEQGEYIYKQGDIDDHFYIIYSGEISIYNNINNRIISSGKVFGDDDLDFSMISENTHIPHKEKINRLWDLVRRSVRTEFSKKKEKSLMHKNLDHVDQVGLIMQQMRLSKPIKKQKEKERIRVDHAKVESKEAIVFSIGAHAFFALMLSQKQTNLKKVVNFLRTSYFPDWEYNRLQHLYAILQFKECKRGEIIKLQNTKADTLYFLFSGEISLYRSVSVTRTQRWPIDKNHWQFEERVYVYSQLVRKLNTTGQFCGEECLEYIPTCDYSIKCTGNSNTILLCLPSRYAHHLSLDEKHKFTKLLQRLREISAEKISFSLKKRFLTSHHQHQFVPIVWAIQESMVSERLLHYTGGATYNEETRSVNVQELDSGCVYVEYNPSADIIRTSWMKFKGNNYVLCKQKRIILQSRR